MTWRSPILFRALIKKRVESKLSSFCTVIMVEEFEGTAEGVVSVSCWGSLLSLEARGGIKWRPLEVRNRTENGLRRLQGGRREKGLCWSDGVVRKETEIAADITVVEVLMKMEDLFNL